MKAKKFEGMKLFIIFILLVVTYSIVISSVSAAPADPGHSAPSIGPGTFEGGFYVFPNNLSVTENFSVDTDTLFVDSTLNRIGIGNNTPEYDLEVDGALGFTAGSTATYGSTALEAVNTYDLRIDAQRSILMVIDENSQFSEGAFQIAWDNPDTIILTVNRTGQVGIGTMSPQNILNVNGTTNITGNLTVNESTLFVNADKGNVGINTTDPQSILHINGTVGSLTGGISFGDGDSGFYENSDDDIRISIAGTERWYITSSILGSVTASGARLLQQGQSTTVPGIRPYGSDTDTGISGDNSDNLYLITGASTKLTIDSNGDVGIGVVSPGAKLHVSNGDILVNNSATPIVDLTGNDAGNYKVGIEGTGGAPNGGFHLHVARGTEKTLSTADEHSTYLTTTYDNPLIFGTNNLERIRILSTGNVGIMETTPDDELTVNGTANATDFVCAGSGCINAVELNSDVAGLGLNTTSGVLAVNILSPGGGIVVSGDQVVLNQSCSDNEILKWNSGSSIWECSTDAGETAGNITGDGTPGTLPVFTSAGYIADSIVSESGNTLTVSGNISMPTNFWIGNGAAAPSTNALAIGYNAQATAVGATSLGPNSDATASYSTAVGVGSQATGGTGATSLGYQANATVGGAIALGQETDATTTNAVALGYQAQATGTSSISLGNSANSTGIYSTAIGVGTDATEDYATAVGEYAQATAQSATALGDDANATGSASTALGRESDATEDYATAVGRLAQATGASSVAMGSNAQSKAYATISIGSNSLATDDSGTAIGRDANATKNYATAIGGGTNATDYYATAIGREAQATAQGSTALGDSANASAWAATSVGKESKAGSESISMGYKAKSTSYRTIALGPYTNAKTDYVTVIGYDANSSYADSVALGRQAVTTATNQFMVGSSSYNLNTYIYGNLNVTTGKDICIEGGNCLSDMGAGGGGNVSGSGSANHVAFWKDDENITYDTDGNFTWNDTENMLGIGTSSPTAKVEVGMSDPVQRAKISGAGSPNYLDNVMSVDVQGKYAYAASAGDDRLTVIDVSNPSSPTVIASLSGCTYADAVDVAGDYAYLGCWTDSELKIVDISDPKNPSIVGTETVGGIINIHVSGKYAYAAEWGNSGGLNVIDVSIPTSPSLVGFVSIPNASGVYVTGKYAYVTTYSPSDKLSNLTAVDVYDPTNPTIVSNLTDNTYLYGGRGITVSGSYAYVAAYSGDYLTIVNVSDPSNMYRISSIGGAGSPNYMDGPDTAFVAGKYVYVHALRDNSLTVIDVSDPSNPTFAGNLSATSGTPPDASANTLVVSGKYAYMVTQNDDSFVVADISGIDTPAMSTGAIQTGGLYVSENADIANSLSVRNGLTVGTGGIFSHGSLSIVNGTLSVVTDHTSSGVLKLIRNVTGRYGWLDVPHDSGSPFSIGVSDGSSEVNAIQFTTDTADLGEVWIPNGDVGINTTMPNETLSVVGNFSVETPVESTTAFQVRNSSDGVVFNIDTTNERVGIKTSSPNEGLYIHGVNIGINTDDGTNRYIKFYEDGSEKIALRYVGSDDTLRVYDYGGSVDRLTIKSSGEVGIMETTPDDELTVNGTANATDFVCAGSGCINAVELNSDVAGLGLNTTSGVLAVNILSPGGGIVVSGDQVVLNQSCTDGQILKWDNGNSVWNCSDDTGGGGADLDWTINGDYVYNDTTNTNIGIGNNTPVTKLAISDPSNQLGIIDSDGGQEWRLSANSDMLFVEDENTGAIPFKIEDGADTDTLLIDDSGNVGIGTTGPTAPLHIDASTTAEALFINSSSTSSTHIAINNTDSIREFEIGVTGTAHSWGSDKFYIWDATAGGDGRLVIDYSGNVGISDTTPQAKLDVNSTNDTIYTGVWSGGSDHYLPADYDGLFIHNEDTTGNFSGLFMRAGGTSVGAGRISLVKTAANEGAFTFSLRSGTSMTEKMRITDTGNVGIGTMSPGAPLHINSSTAGTSVLRITASDDIEIFNFRETTGGAARLNMDNTVGTTTVRLDTNGDSYFTGGEVGIGTTNPNATQLHINRTNNANLTIWSEAVNGNSSILLRESTGGSGVELFYVGNNNELRIKEIGGSPIMTIERTGNVSIGETAPDAKLEVLGTVTPQFRLTHTEDTDFGDFEVDSDGNLTISSSSGNVIIKLG